MAVEINQLVAGQSVPDHVSKTGASVMSNGLVIFTVVGDIQIVSLISECYSANDTTASTLIYSFTNTGTATSTDLSAATTTLASKGAGAAIALSAASTLGEVPNQSANAAGAVLNTSSRGIRIPSGQLKLTVGVGSTTGTWKHYLRYEPLEAGAYVVAAF